jgi:magnesium chelatase family protein
LSRAPLAAESSAAVAARVAAAQVVQRQRQGKLNSRLTAAEVGVVCELSREARVLVGTAIARLKLSARAYHRVLKLARSCADLASEPQIRAVDVSEAVRLRALDRATC